MFKLLLSQNPLHNSNVSFSFSLKLAVLNRLLQAGGFSERVPETAKLMKFLLCQKEEEEEDSEENKPEWHERFESACVHGECIIVSYTFACVFIWLCLFMFVIVAN